MSASTLEAGVLLLLMLSLLAVSSLSFRAAAPGLDPFAGRNLFAPALAIHLLPLQPRQGVALLKRLLQGSDLSYYGELCAALV